MTDASLLALVTDLGVAKAALIHTDQIRFSLSFRDVCASNGCGMYGQCWTCPPDCGPAEELIGRVKSFSKGVLYQTVGRLEDSFDVDGMNEAKKTHVLLADTIETQIGDLLPHRLHLSCGGCGLCAKCAKADSLPCRHPDRALLSLEACCIDVYQTTAQTDLKYVNGANTVTYFGLILYD